MRSPLASAALLCAGLATGPALASSTAIIDFTIEIRYDENDSEVRHPLFADKFPGDQFDGFLVVSDPPVNVQVETAPLFPLETLNVDGFDPVFFTDPIVELVSIESGSEGDFSVGERVGGVIFSEGKSGDLFLDLFALSEFVLLNDVRDFGAADLLLILTSPGVKSFGVSNRREDADDAVSDSLRFDIISASIRPDTTPIPLPAAGWLLLAGLGGLTALRRSPA